LLSFLSLAFAWTKEDHEIFDLVSAIETAEGKGTTFYSWLDVSSKATSTEISRAYRKMSMALHPDKNPGVKGIEERFARLGVVAAILRDDEGRKRYDFFYKNGVPRWRGTGYYYSRYRPGLVFVVVFLTILTSVLQNVVQRYNYRKDLDRINRFILKARVAAWGPKMTPQTTPKKVRVSLANTAAEEDGRSIEMLVEGEYVYLLGDAEPVLLDASIASKPSIWNTWAIKLVRSLLAKVSSKSNPKAKAVEDDTPEAPMSAEEDTDAGDGTDGRVSTPSGRKVGPAGMAKVGGRRRNVPKKR